MFYFMVFSDIISTR